MTRRATLALLAALLLAALGARVGYVLAQRSYDPSFARPMLDGEYYSEWGKRLAAGGGEPEGAFYLAPLYPHALAVFFRVLGERHAVLALTQNVLALGVALLLFEIARRSTGPLPGLLACALALTYHPLLFFASRPVGEVLALMLLALALVVARCHGRGAAFLSGLLAGASALARPNLLLVPAGLVLADAWRRRWARALALAAGVLLSVLPVTLRNSTASGHLVPISANDGITLYHGNGPGALGVFTPAEGLSGDLLRQREEVQAKASFLAGRRLDPVEADRFFRSEAIRARLTDIPGTLSLLFRRALLLFDDFEHGLDYPPFLDENPWRRAAPTPFALVFGLAAAGVVALGFRRTGGAAVWVAIAAAAATPLVFYVSSRYRLPFAVLLCVPAGVGLASLLGFEGAPSRRRWAGALAGAVCAIASLAVPSWEVRRSEEAAALANRGVLHRRAGDLPAAERDLRRALDLDSHAAAVWYNLGVVLAASARLEDAERAYREALTVDPGQAEAAGNLSVLLVNRGEAEAAIPILRRALESRPGDATLWTNLVVALSVGNHAPEAREAVRSALLSGVALDPKLVEAVRGGGVR